MSVEGANQCFVVQCASMRAKLTASKHCSKLAANIITTPDVSTESLKKDLNYSQRVLGTIDKISERQAKKKK